MLFRYCCPLKSLNVLRIIANKLKTKLFKARKKFPDGKSLRPGWIVPLGESKFKL